MKNSRKIVLAALAALAFAIAGTSAFAMPSDCGMMPRGGLAGASSGKIAAFMEKRHAELHQKLNLSTEQEAAWKTFSEKMQAVLPKDRSSREEMGKLSAPERMDKMLTMMKERGQHMETATAAIKEFYAVLTPEQRKQFDQQPAWKGRHFR